MTDKQRVISLCEGKYKLVIDDTYGTITDCLRHDEPWAGKAQDLLGDKLVHSMACRIMALEDQLQSVFDRLNDTAEPVQLDGRTLQERLSDLGDSVYPKSIKPYSGPDLFGESFATWWGNVGLKVSVKDSNGTAATGRLLKIAPGIWGDDGSPIALILDVKNASGHHFWPCEFAQVA